jgi:MFS transporter, DHA3 family, macrolide efflux protein
MSHLSRPSQKSLWSHEAFRGLFLSTIFFTFGFTIYGLCLPLIVYDLTKSAEYMGIVRGVEFLPNLFFAIFVGIFFDRVDRKKWAIILLIGQSMMVAGLYMACHFMSNPLPVIIPGTFITMLICYAYFNASFGLQKISLSLEHQQASMSMFSSARRSLRPSAQRCLE